MKIKNKLSLSEVSNKLEAHLLEAPGIKEDISDLKTGLAKVDTNVGWLMKSVGWGVGILTVLIGICTTTIITFLKN